MRIRPSLILIAVTFPISVCSAEHRLEAHQKGIWSLPASPTENRWLVIHGLAQSLNNGVYHIEVLGRRPKDPAWKVRHIVNHMAVSEQALLRSAIMPLTRGAVYPESFDNAYREWQSQNDGTGGGVCRTDILDCLEP